MNIDKARRKQRRQHLLFRRSGYLTVDAWIIFPFSIKISVRPSLGTGYTAAIFYSAASAY
jgi:hypothetical protein